MAAVTPSLRTFAARGFQSELKIRFTKRARKVDISNINRDWFLF